MDLSTTMTSLVKYSILARKLEKEAIGSSSEHRRKEAKNSRLDKLDVALTQWSEIRSARAEASKAKAEQYKTQASQATSPISDPYSIGECMILLDSMKDIPSKIYNKALEKFTSKDWR
ncbi:hypothetical protein VNO77_26797 [Canavalia gladiata]|uniref:Uncharacterized protein n=1 Tax=Canavalia gladiata TaxID=3824 RepID=A0AAN9Q5X1_CANGL